MKFLILGDASSMHMLNYIKHIALKENYEVTIFSLSPLKIPEEYYDFYTLNNVKIVSQNIYKNGEKNKKIVLTRFINFFKKWKSLRKIGRFDIAQLQFVNKSGVLLLFLNRKLYKKILITYWGSDILQINNRLKRIQRIILNYADAISLCTEEMLRKFKIEYGSKYDDKLFKVNIIVGPLYNIKKIASEEKIVDMKSKFDFPQNKFLFYCGYNGNVAQRQDELVSLLSDLDTFSKSKIHLIIPFMYGVHDKNYAYKVKELLQKSGFSYTVLEDRLSYDDMARLSIVTDLYFHLRSTDALSASMQEQLFAGSTIIRGKWLKYDEIEGLNLPVYAIENFEEIPKIVEKFLISSNINNDRVPELSMEIWNMSSGEMSRIQSKQIFSRLNNE